MRPNNQHGQKSLRRLMIGLGVLMCSHSISAKDLGVMGATYPIAETDFVTMAQKKIQEEMNTDKESGWQDQQKASIMATADRPLAVPGLRPTIQNRHWFLDPSFVVPIDVRSANGSILMKAGSRFNPLEKINLKNALIFFDGDDPEQVAWAQKKNEALKGRDVLILVNGSLRAASLQLPHQRVYFDQGGRITQKLQITQVPAIVQQVGDQLEISEVTP